MEEVCFYTNQEQEWKKSSKYAAPVVDILNLFKTHFDDDGVAKGQTQQYRFFILLLLLRRDIFLQRAQGSLLRKIL